MAIEQLHDDYMAFRDEYDGGNQEGFVVNDDSRAEWAVRRIAQAEANIEKRREFVDAEIERLRAWQEREDERDQATITRMTGLLQPYFEHLRESGALGNRKSYKLPSGTLQLRSSGVKYARNDDELLPYAEQVGLVRVKVTPDWSELKKRLASPDGHTVVDVETGEIVPGVSVAERASEQFSVKVVRD